MAATLSNRRPGKGTCRTSFWRRLELRSRCWRAGSTAGSSPKADRPFCERLEKSVSHALEITEAGQGEQVDSADFLDLVVAQIKQGDRRG